jgi:hypothetical protein
MDLHLYYTEHHDTIYQTITHHEVLWMPKVQCTWGFWVNATWENNEKFKVYQT